MSSGTETRRPRVDHILIALMFAGMALISFVNILGRYLFRYSLAYTEELTINLFVWMTVLGSGIAFERHAHLGMVTFYRRFPATVRRVLRFSHAGLATLLFLAVDLALLHTIRLEMTLFHAKSPSLGLPVWIYDAGVIVCSLWVFLGIVRGLRQPPENEQEGV